MCNAVNHKGRWYNTPAELAEFLGGADKLVWQESNPFAKWPADKDWHVMDSCLCPLNLEAYSEGGGLDLDSRRRSDGVVFGRAAMNWTSQETQPK